MKLAEVEQKAREQQKVDLEIALQKIAAERIAEQEACEKFRQKVIVWMVQEANLDTQELEAMLSVPDMIGELYLNVPEHQPITFTVLQSSLQKDGGWRVESGEFYVTGPDSDSWPIRCRSLGEALIEAGMIWHDQEQLSVCDCGMGDASIPELHTKDCAINQAGS